jgi:sodium-dependent dicarboxylate transporter 2/3/5
MFERGRKMKKILIYVISLLFVFGFRFVPPAAGMTASGMQVLGVFIGTLILWLTTAIDWPSILCLAGLSLVPELSMNSILASSFGNATFTFLLFTFICTYALSKTSFVKRCAVAFISNRIAQKGSWWFVTLYCLSILIIGLFISPVVLFVVYLPILDTICHELGLTGEDKLANCLALGQMLCCCFSCGMTPIAHVFAVMAIGFYQQATGNVISYAQYMTAAIPVGIICFIVMMLVFRFILRPDMSKLKSIDLSGLREELQPMDKREVYTLAIFFAVVIMWVVPGFLKTAAPAVYTFFNAKGTTFPPMFGAVALFLLSVDGNPLLNFKEAFGKGIQWGSLVMAAATLAVGAAMTNEEIGLTAWLSNTISPALSGLAPYVVVLIFMVWAYVMTNTCSNMVTVTVVSAVAIPICMASGGSVNAAAVAAMIGMAASYAFVLPPAHPNVAVAIGSGWTNTSQVVIYGAIMMVVALVATLLVGYPIAAAVMPM